MLQHKKRKNLRMVVFLKLKSRFLQIVSIFYEMLQPNENGLFLPQFESFERDIDTKEAFYFELKAPTLDFQINDIDKILSLKISYQ
ncbi:MAG: hypothetical protein J7574_12855 [Flavobacterium sp.]|uniref:hypothetical protein n=1 Tax=Flavobacterium sp. TaxID=239 RepID=UPI001B0084E5|nr:hypothetical protein [Flavobacterium sp.]MBO9585043.1 hypothetical protein [Flavobacterium sp.]